MAPPQTTFEKLLDKGLYASDIVLQPADFRASILPISAVSANPLPDNGTFITVRRRKGSHGGVSVVYEYQLFAYRNELAGKTPAELELLIAERQLPQHNVCEEVRVSAPVEEQSYGTILAQLHGDKPTLQTRIKDVFTLNAFPIQKNYSCAQPGRPEIDDVYEPRTMTAHVVQHVRIYLQQTARKK
jgi:hypothetical protein